MENNDFFQVFVRLIDKKTLTLQLPIQQDQRLLPTAKSIKQQLQSLTHVPIEFQRLTLNGKFLHDESPISPSISLSTIQLNLSLLGGKGGFGSLLRGAATKAGQKKTNNFDACRDMSGRRLRHVNVEKKLEEWKAEEEERQLEKKAEEYLKNVAKKARKKGGSEGAEKYVERYREESARCVKEVESSVRESVGELMVGKKRKLMEKLKAKAKAAADGKKLKIWMGKRLLAESDSDDSDNDGSEDDDVENEKSVIIDTANQSNSSKEVEGSSGSVSIGLSDGECYHQDSSESSSEKEKETVTGGSLDSDGSPRGSNGHLEGSTVVERSSETDGQKTNQSEKLSSSAEEVLSSAELMEMEKQQCFEPTFVDTKVVVQPSSISNLGELGECDKGRVVAEANGIAKSKSVVWDEEMDGGRKEEEEQPLNFEDFSSAAELVVLGMDRLKSELQSRGLKCGGTLHERAARLFLLKTTPLEQMILTANNQNIGCANLDSIAISRGGVSSTTRRTCAIHPQPLVNAIGTTLFSDEHIGQMPSFEAGAYTALP
ncbi:hypothetical protein Nepgr_002260 [Nepenthes gracilis]|uniref:Ubiquitin-like domain-containing protein n=1 Tax=Nepenthes gracilis TaxID=150966 RepID=A0AAD3P6J4_NEPGR|nr:hypothetical protein Nepgr_002260 [Nepenthes gracilis]